MAPAILSVLLLHIAITLLTSSASGGDTTAAEPSDITGFSLPLLRRRNHNANLTGWELMAISAETTHLRTRQLASMAAATNNDDDATTRIRPAVLRSPFSSLRVVIRIGSKKQPFTLILDTAGGLSWVHCIKCNTHGRCIRVFDPSTSSTYRPMEVDDPLCVPGETFRHDGHHCNFSVAYIDGDTAKCVASRDDFTFPTSEDCVPDFVTLKDIAFGCAGESHSVNNNSPEGVLGMGRSPESFIQQAKHHVAGRFSYCHTRSLAARSGYLRFGSDIHLHGDRIRTVPLVAGGSLYYGLALKRIRLNGKNIAAAAGNNQQQLILVIDSGSDYSALMPEVYRELKLELSEYLDGFHKLWRMKHESRLCYHMAAEGFEIEKHLPAVHFDFDNGDSLEVAGQDVFQVVHGGGAGAAGHLCLAMVEDKHQNMNVLGAYQQNNHRFVFDVVNNQVQFAEEDCLQDWRHD